MAYLDDNGLLSYHRKIVDLINDADEDLQNQINALTASDGEKVADVQVNGTSVVVSHAANIPVASSSALGVVKINSNYGVDLSQSDGQSLTIMKAGDDAIKVGSVETKAIVPANQHTSVFYGLAKAAGDVTQSLSENTIGTYTDAAKSKIREMIDAASAQDVEDLSSTVDRNFLDKAPVICETVEDAAVATFSDGMPGLPVKEAVFNIDPVQSGSGDPAVDNVRAINAIASCSISHSGSDTTDPTVKTITFPSEAGDVYGGTLTVKQDGSGILSKEWVKLNVNWSSNSLTCYSSGSGSSMYWSINVSSADVSSWGNVVVNCLPTAPITTNDTFVGAKTWATSGGTKRIGFRPPNASNLTSSALFKNYMSSLDPALDVLYKTVTPETIELTASQVGQILILAGENNIWCDTGNTTVKYPVDTKAYIDGTNVEMKAAGNVENGKYFHVGKKLYLATTAIAAGETVVPGTNCMETTFAEALNAILAQ